MKKILSKIVSAAAALAAAAVMSVTVCAEDISLDVSAVKPVGPWENVPFTMDHYDPSKFTPETEVKITFTYEINADAVTKAAEASGVKTEDEIRTEAEALCPVEMIVQSWSNPDTPMVNASGGVWAKVAPSVWDEASAVFTYADMVAAYGTEDFTGVDSLNFGATEYFTLTITGVTITNCNDGVYVEMTDAERAEAYKNALIAVLASALALIIIIIVVFMLILKRKSSYAYDASTGEYVKIEKK